MKKKKRLLLVALAFLLAACEFDFSVTSSVTSTNSEQSSLTSSAQGSSGISSTSNDESSSANQSQDSSASSSQSTSTTSGTTSQSSSLPSEESSSGSSQTTSVSSETSSEPSTSTAEPSRPTSGKEALDFYAINDFHGALSENQSMDEPGLSRVATYLKNKKIANPDNTIIISTGDMWQGTFEAYHNKGEVVTAAMNNIGFDLMTIGNHEFDWGPDYIRDNMAQANFPLLGANIMEYPAVSQKSDIGEEYTILQRGHLKIGVIGVIGQNQMTSISSRMIEDIYFKNMTPIVETLSTKLRSEEQVDVVALAIHAGQGDVPNSLADNKYVDVVFNAHTHQVETKVQAGVPFIQGGTKGRYVSHIQIEYDYATKKITTKKHENIRIDYSLTQDSSVETIINNYKANSDAASSVVVGTLSDDLNSNVKLPRVLNYAVARLAAVQGYHDLDFVFSGSSREALFSGMVTYGDLYKALPFDNEVYIVKVLGSDLLSQKNYNTFYRVKDYSSISNYNKYYLAVQDFSILHQDINKVYNYFPNFNPLTDIVGSLKDSNGNIMFPRDILLDEFQNAPGQTINPSLTKYNDNRHTNFTF